MLNTLRQIGSMCEKGQSLLGLLNQLAFKLYYTWLLCPVQSVVMCGLQMAQGPAVPCQLLSYDRQRELEMRPSFIILCLNAVLAGITFSTTISAFNFPKVLRFEGTLLFKQAQTFITSVIAMRNKMKRWREGEKEDKKLDAGGRQPTEGMDIL